jgi:tRNA wybutosine-synthesizing protein 4
VSSDPLPWQCLTRYPTACGGVKFIDVDYRELMLRKRDAVRNTKELVEVLTGMEVPGEGSILFRSDQYLQLGCDLRDLEGLSRGLAGAVDIDNCAVLFTAEVSITYMNADAADSLIQWASRLPRGTTTLLPHSIPVSDAGTAQFCLLEQLLPDGVDHPFAQTMMAHFKKLQTPLGAVERYPTTSAQHQRFETLGWSNISARNLWELWGSPDFLSPGDRSSLDVVEPFDEWEEFALFGCHYILLTADNLSGTLQTRPDELSPPTNPSLHAEIVYSENPNTHGCRRFAAGLLLRSPVGSGDSVGNFAGMGITSRQSSCDLYSNETRNQPFDFFASSIPPSRMCFTITDLGDSGALLVGGRTSPDNALADCWIYHKWPRVWERIDDLPQPRYRHGAVNLGGGSVLISPGRSDSRIIGSAFFMWNRRFGWKRCGCGTSEIPHATYGSTFTVFANSATPQKSVLACGLITGGLAEDGVVRQEIWEWELQHPSSDQVSSFIVFLPALFHYMRTVKTNMQLGTYHKL